MRSKIAAALSDLENAMGQLRQSSPITFSPPATLIRIVKEDPAGAVSRPLPSDEELVRKWRQHIQSPGSVEVSLRDTRILSWDPTISLSPSFIDHLCRDEFLLPRKICKGLLYAALCQPPEAQGAHFRMLLSKIYPRSSAGSQRYLDSIKPFFDSGASLEQFIKLVISQRRPLVADLESYFKFQVRTTIFLQSCLALAIKLGLPTLNSPHSEARSWFFQELLRPADLNTIASFFEALLSRTQLLDNPAVRNELKSYIVQEPRLGDPRIPNNEEKWRVFPESTREQISTLFSEDDIRLFFELLLDDRSDTQHRKEFWLQYAHAVVRTRLLIPQWMRKDKNQPIFSKNNFDSQVFGVLQFETARKSVFVMDFGPITCVEFSESGNACFIYKRESAFTLSKNFWTDAVLPSALKDKDICTHRLIHRMSSKGYKKWKAWHEEFETVLCKHGIRPRGSGSAY